MKKYKVVISKTAREDMAGIYNFSSKRDIAAKIVEE